MGATVAAASLVATAKLERKNTLNIKEKIQRLEETMHEQSSLAKDVNRELDRALESVMVAGVRVERVKQSSLLETTLLVRLPTVELLDWLSSRELPKEPKEDGVLNRGPGWREGWGAMTNGSSFPSGEHETTPFGIGYDDKVNWYVTDGRPMTSWGFVKAHDAAARAEELNNERLKDSQSTATETGWNRVYGWREGWMSMAEGCSRPQSPAAPFGIDYSNQRKWYVTDLKKGPEVPLAESNNSYYTAEAAVERAELLNRLFRGDG